MTIQADFWHLVGLLLGFLGFCGAGGVALLKQTMHQLDTRFKSAEESRTVAEQKMAERLSALESTNRDEMLQWQRVEREMLKFQADMPLRYVMRDDYIRGQTIIEAKLDAVMAKVDNARLRAVLTEGVP